jgi:hypothetical protein
MWLLLASAVVFLVAVVTASAFVFLRAREFFRTLGAFSEAADDGLRRLSDGAARLGDGPSAANLAPSLSRLRASQAQLSVLLAAVADVRAAAGRARAVVPQK